MVHTRGQKLAADRSASAAEVSAAEAKRSADAASDLVAIERGRRDEELAAALAQRVQFRLYHHGGERYVLRNDGNGPAYNVRVETGDMGVESDRHQFPVFGSGAETDYLLGLTYSTTDPVVRVYWHQEPDASDKQQVTELPVRG